jgi:hypothetical protein
MAEAKHTPGPWRIVENRPNKWTKAPTISVVGPPDPQEDGAYVKICLINGADKANARLIAAAPDMATEIRKQIDWLKHARPDCAGLVRGSILNGFDQSIKYLEAVLAKAEGRS